MREGKFPKHAGLCNIAISKQLHSLGVDRQAYQGGAFIGNHVHKCCQVNHLTAMSDDFPKLIRETIQHILQVAYLSKTSTISQTQEG